MRRMMTGTIAGGMMLFTAEAMAQEPESGRYSMQRTETGIARLDTQTGEVSLCQEKDGQMVCRIAADERTAFELELDLLTKRVEALEKSAPDRLTDLKPRLPTQEEIDRTMTVMEKLMRDLMGVVKGLENGDRQPDEGTGAVPQKT